MTGRRWVAAMALVIAIGAFLLISTHRVPGGPPPPGMIGSWITDNPRYADRYITIKPDSITFGIGGARTNRYKLLGCEERMEDGQTLFILHMADAGGAVYNRPLYLSDDFKQLRFKNQFDVIWTRSP